jgi:hypothetical protein
MIKTTSISKIEQVKEIAWDYPYRIMSINSLHFHITGSEGGAIWHEPLMNVSKSTVRRVLKDLVKNEGWFAFYVHGHCYDEKLFRKAME